MAHALTNLLNSPESLQPLIRKLPVIVSFLLVIACAQVLSQITWALLVEEDEQVTVSKQVTPKKTSNTSDIQAFRQLTGAHLFGIAGKNTSKTVTKAPETKLNLVLKGVLASNPMKAASVIISQGKNGKEDIYSIGDKLSGGVTIKEIHPEHVILERRGQLETLRLPKDDQIGSIIESDEPVQTAKLTPQATDLKDIRQNIIKNPASFTQYAVPVVVKENGKQVGYRLQPREKGEALSELGLEPNDIITEINGVKLDDPTKSMGALRKLQSANQLNVTVKRNGAEVPLNIQLK